MFRKATNPFALRLCGALITLSLLLAACTTPAAVPTATQVPPPASTATRPAPTASLPPAPAATQAPQGISAVVTVDGVALGFTPQVIAAVPPRKDAPWWEAMPQYTQLTLTGYPVSGRARMPQIFVFPVKDLGVNETAAKAAEGLQALLQNRQAGKELPFLPLTPSEKQVMHAQVKYLDFKTGKGVRFLTQYGNGMGSINNRELIYTFQGLTGDGKYYVAAVLPVNLQGLPADGTDKSHLPSDFPNNFSQYLADTVSLLEQNPAGAYTPDLNKLDVMVQSIEVK